MKCYELSGMNKKIKTARKDFNIHSAFIDIPNTGTFKNRIFESHWCIRTETIWEIFDQKNPKNNIQINLRSTLSKEVETLVS